MVVPHAAYVGSTVGAGTVFSPQIFLRGHAKAPLDPLNSIRSPRTILAASWDCRKCGCINDSAKNKRRCFSCRAWRDGKALLSAASIAIAIADAHGGGGASFCSDENDAPNNASPRKVGSPKKRGGKRKSTSVSVLLARRAYTSSLSAHSPFDLETSGHGCSTSCLLSPRSSRCRSFADYRNAPRVRSRCSQFSLPASPCNV